MQVPMLSPAAPPSRRRASLPLSHTLVAVLMGIVGPAEAAYVRALPPPRPAELDGAAPAPEPAPPSPEPAPVQPAEAPQPAGSDGTCLARLAAIGLVAEPARDQTARGAACTIEEPVRLNALKGERGAAIAFPDRPVVACRLAEPLGRWLAGIVAPVVAVRLGSPLNAVRTGPGYECRPRNRVAGAKMSAHGLGLAIDIAGFDLANGGRVTVAPPGRPGAATLTPWPDTFAALRIASCGWFTTVLGPGSDPYHGDHLHLDIQQHGSSDRYRICQ
jgi:hypothetical protein